MRSINNTTLTQKCSSLVRVALAVAVMATTVCSLPNSACAAVVDEEAMEYVTGGAIEVSVVTQEGYVFDASDMSCIGSLDEDGNIWNDGVIVGYMVSQP